MASTSTDPAPGVPAAPARGVPLYYLGITRTWWVVLCLLLLVAVDAVPTIGPYLALGALLWMVAGLARARPRPPTAGRAPAPTRRARAEPSSPLPSA